MTDHSGRYRQRDIKNREWMERAACRGMNVDLFFPEPGNWPADAYLTCNRCPVRLDCLEYGLRNEDDGVFGGMSAKERKRHRNAGRGAVEALEYHELHGRTDKRTAEHGTRSGYVSGCRCDECRRAQSDYDRFRYQQKGQTA
jgi:WhiB family redox-sensing transcriptional regulator